MFFEKKGPYATEGQGLVCLGRCDGSRKRKRQGVGAEKETARCSVLSPLSSPSTWAQRCYALLVLRYLTNTLSPLLPHHRFRHKQAPLSSPQSSLLFKMFHVQQARPALQHAHTIPHAHAHAHAHSQSHSHPHLYSHYEPVHPVSASSAMAQLPRTLPRPPHQEVQVRNIVALEPKLEGSSREYIRMKLREKSDECVCPPVVRVRSGADRLITATPASLRP
jgi:hypothetical protein